MKFFRIAAGTTLLLAAFAMAQGPGLRMRLGTIGKGAEARWISQGKGDHALFLAKYVPLEEFEAAGADFSPIAGTLVSDLNNLAWTVEDRTEGASIRWNIYLGPAGSDEITSIVQLGEVQTGTDGLLIDAEIETLVQLEGASLTDEIKYLQIIMDEPGTVTVDDISVQIGTTTYTFNGPGNSG